MSKIAAAFDHGKTFIAFITCGDPDLETTGRAVRAAVANGADLIELGIPFSDPTAEGPVIQEANLRALKAGTTTDRIFDFVQELRRDVTVPMVFMTYANVIFSYGAEKFISTCEKIGIDGLILPDLPFEEKEEFLPLCRQYHVDLVSGIQPGCDRNPQRDYHGPEADHPDHPGECEGAGGHRLRDLPAGAGQSNGRHFRRRYCRIGNRKDSGAIRKRRAGTHRRIREQYEKSCH